MNTTSAISSWRSAGVTRWVYLEVRQHQSAQDADAFLQHVRERAPFKIRPLLTDNGKAFTDRFAASVSPAASTGWTGSVTSMALNID